MLLAFTPRNESFSDHPGKREELEELNLDKLHSA